MNTRQLDRLTCLSWFLIILGFVMGQATVIYLLLKGGER